MKLARLWLANQGLTKSLHVKIRVAVEAKEETKKHAKIETQQKAAEEEEARLKAEEEVKVHIALFADSFAYFGAGIAT